MAELPFWFHPDSTAEVLVAHDRYFDVTPELAEDVQNELERSRAIIARSTTTWPSYLHGTQRFLMKRFPYFIDVKRSFSMLLLLGRVKKYCSR